MLVYSAAITGYQSSSKHQHVQHITQHITLRQSIDRSEESQFLRHEAQAIHCNHFRMKSFYSPFHFPLILWLNVWHVPDRILAEMVSISPNIYTAIAHHVASVDRKTVNWTWFPFNYLQNAGGIHCYHFRIQRFYSPLCFALILLSFVWLVLHSRTKWRQFYQHYAL